MFILWGSPGTGKSAVVRRCLQWLYGSEDNLYDLRMPKPSDLVRFPNYDVSVHTDVLMEEFAGQIGINDIKKWVDRWPFKARTYGGEHDIRPLRFWITSNYPPSEWYGGQLNADDQAALAERTTVSKRCYADSSLPLGSPERFRDTNEFYEDFVRLHPKPDVIAE